jgi:hypothetical protein
MSSSDTDESTSSNMQAKNLCDMSHLKNLFKKNTQIGAGQALQHEDCNIAVTLNHSYLNFKLAI